MSQPPPPPNEGMVERLAAIATRMTWANVGTMALLIAVIVPAFGVWRFLTDPQLRDDFLDMVKERADLAPGCSVYETKVNSVKRFHVSALVLPGPDGNDYMVAGRMHGNTTPKEIVESCARLHKLADHLREKVPDVDDRYATGGTSP